MVRGTGTNFPTHFIIFSCRYLLKNSKAYNILKSYFLIFNFIKTWNGKIHFLEVFPLNLTQDIQTPSLTYSQLFNRRGVNKSILDGKSEKNYWSRLYYRNINNWFFFAKIGVGFQYFLNIFWCELSQDMVISLDTRANNMQKTIFLYKICKRLIYGELFCIPKCRIKVEVRSARKGVDTKN